MKSVPRDTSQAGRSDDAEHVRTGLSADAIAKALIDNLHCLQAKAAAARDAQRLVHGARLYRARPHAATATSARSKRSPDAHIPIKVVAYLSAEFLTGPHLGNSLINLGIWEATEEALCHGRAGPA